MPAYKLNVSTKLFSLCLIRKVRCGVDYEIYKERCYFSRPWRATLDAAQAGGSEAVPPQAEGFPYHPQSLRKLTSAKVYNYSGEFFTFKGTVLCLGFKERNLMQGNILVSFLSSHIWPIPICSAAPPVPSTASENCATNC